MAVHQRIAPESVSTRPVERLHGTLRVAACAALLGVLAGCVTHSPPVPDPTPETPVPETPPENEDGWKAVSD